MSNHHSQVLWTRGLLIRRNIADGDLAYFTDLVSGRDFEIQSQASRAHRWAIEDSFETTKNELGLDHNEIAAPGTAGIATSRSSCSPSP